MLKSAIVQRLVLPALSIIIAVGVVEASIQLRYHPGFWQKTTWLLHDPYRGSEIFDRAELYVRLSHVEDSDPDIISVGDSSGFFSLQSKIVNTYIPGHKFISLNTGANQAYIGYSASAEYMLRRSKHIKYVVLYLYPQLLPVEPVIKVADLGPITESDLVSLRAYATPPSAFLSPYVKSLVFEDRRYRSSEPIGNSVPLLQLEQTVDSALGWLPEFDVRYDRIDGRTRYYRDTRTGWYNHLGLTDPSAINANLDEFDKMVRSYGARLVIAFAPQAVRSNIPGDPNIPIDDQALARFQREHPDVKFLFPLVTRWGFEKFGMFNHISREYTFLSSERLGKALATLLRDPEAIRPYTAQYKDPGPYSPITVTPSGPPDRALLAPALALFRRSTSGDEADAELLSSRVRQLLADEPAYQFMMTDARERTASLQARGIAIGYDLSELQAVPVTVTGVPPCDPRPDLQWVQLYGTMIFTYDSPAVHSREPVSWPETSRILIPTVIEDGTRKFDGYCPEPSMSDSRSTAP